MNANQLTSQASNPKLKYITDTGLSLNSGRVIKKNDRFEFEFSYLGNSGFEFGDYLKLNRFTTFMGLNLLKTTDFLSFGTGFGILKIDNYIKKKELTGVTIKEQLRDGTGYYPYIKILIELKYSLKRFEFFSNITSYFWIQKSSDIEVEDNGENHKTTMPLLHSIRSFNIGLRYYFN